MMGHSMGGYITLMFHKLFPEKLLGFSLFHSHPFSDSEETKKKRMREIDFVKRDKKDLIAKFNIPNAFADNNLNILKDKIQNSISIALNTETEGIIANLKAMMNRPDLSESLAKSNIPFLCIVGKHDNYINFETVVPTIKLPQTSEFHILENSGHMGFIEEEEKSIQIINRFINQL